MNARKRLKMLDVLTVMSDTDEFQRYLEAFQREAEGDAERAVLEYQSDPVGWRKNHAKLTHKQQREQLAAMRRGRAAQ